VVWGLPLRCHRIENGRPGHVSGSLSGDFGEALGRNFSASIGQSLGGSFGRTTREGGRVVAAAHTHIGDTGCALAIATDKARVTEMHQLGSFWTWYKMDAPVVHGKWSVQDEQNNSNSWVGQ
jgi:hypothetical protein